MVQATDRQISLREVARAAVDDPATADVIVALVDLVGGMHRSRLLHHQGAPLQALLSHLAKCGPMRPSDLASSMHIDQSTVSRHLARLESDQLVERQSDPDDRRASLVQATPAGVDVARASMLERLREFEAIIDDWPRTDREDFARLLDRFTHEFETRINQGAQP